MPVPVLQGQMNEEDGKVVHFEFNNESLYARIEIMKSLSMDSVGRKKRIALFSNDRQHLIE